MAIDKESLNRKIFQILIANGLKATTMDSVAANLSISKRTLYEVYADKMDMVKCAMKSEIDIANVRIRELYERSDNVMEALKKIFSYQASQMSKISSKYIREIEKYPEIRDFLKSEHN